MASASLAGRLILIIEDQPLIALDIAGELERAGATAIRTHSVASAAPLVEHEKLSAAIVDFRLRDGDASALCARLRSRCVPFVLHTGYEGECDTHGSVAVIRKPAHQGALVDALAAVFGQPIQLSAVRRDPCDEQRKSGSPYPI